MKKPDAVQTDVPGRIADRLTVMLGLLALLQNGAFGDVTARQKMALEEALATSEELRQLLRDLLNP